MTNTEDQPASSGSAHNRHAPGPAVKMSSPDHERLPAYSGGEGLERLLTAIDDYVTTQGISDAEATTILINKLEGYPYTMLAMHRQVMGVDPTYSQLKTRLRNRNLADVKPRLNPFAPDGLLALRAEPNETPAALFLRVSTHCLPKEQARIMAAADNAHPEDWPADARQSRIYSRTLRDRIFATVCPPHWRATLSQVDFTKASDDIFNELCTYDALANQGPAIDAVNRFNQGQGQGNRRNNNNNNNPGRNNNNNNNNNGNNGNTGNPNNRQGQRPQANRPRGTNFGFRPKKLFCTRCKQWGVHSCDSCRYSRREISAMTAADPNVMPNIVQDERHKDMAIPFNNHAGGQQQQQHQQQQPALLPPQQFQNPQQHPQTLPSSLPNPQQQPQQPLNAMNRDPFSSF